MRLNKRSVTHGPHNDSSYLRAEVSLSETEADKLNGEQPDPQLEQELYLTARCWQTESGPLRHNVTPPSWHITCFGGEWAAWLTQWADSPDKS